MHMSKSNPYKLNIASIPSGVSEYDFMLTGDFFSHMGNSDILDADVAAHLSITHKNEAYYCSFILKGTLTLSCDRCLDPMSHQVDTRYDVTVKSGPEYDDSTEGLLVIPDNQASLDVADMMYDTAVLTIPMRHVHPDGECNPAVAGLIDSADDESESDEYTDGPQD